MKAVKLPSPSIMQADLPDKHCLQFTAFYYVVHTICCTRSGPGTGSSRHTAPCLPKNKSEATMTISFINKKRHNAYTRARETFDLYAHVSYGEKRGGTNLQAKNSFGTN